MKDIENLTETQIKERLNGMEQPEKFDILRAVLAIQDAVSSMDTSKKEVVLALWTRNILSYDRILDLIKGSTGTT
ncbi:MAG: hypothetical protein HFJ29_00005 [Clostridia bacterium]|nr:hypothetical protein [Clostridia bacterium]